MLVSAPYKHSCKLWAILNSSLSWDKVFNLDNNEITLLSKNRSVSPTKK